MPETCFIIMPIGDQECQGVTKTRHQLRALYNDLIKEALLKARPGLEVVRADDVSGSGDITAEVFRLIMESDFVVADVSYPNPNVFYELGLRHAFKTGTILLRDSASPKPPFDLSALRHIEYENTASGLKDLAAKLKKTFASYDNDPGRPDNQFLALAEPRFALPRGGETYQVLQIGKDGKPIWDWVRAAPG